MSSLKIFGILAAKIIFIFFVFLKASQAYTQTGCTDTSAYNYDPLAKINDGSCQYNATNYFPPVKVDPISDTLRESSGLQWANNSLWSFNDKGGTPDLYRIDTASRAILQTVHLEGATNVDWEEVTFDGTYFYVGDFGNNLDGARTDLKIYKFPYSAIPDYITNPEASINSEQINIINFKYRDQEDHPVAVALDSTKFDCEAMIVDNGKIHLFTKDWINYTSTHYVINSTLPGSYTATPVDTLKTGYLVTAASKAPAQKMIILLGYLNGLPGNHYMHLLYDYSGGKYFNGNKRQISLPTAIEMGQAEGITFRNDNYGYISNERLQANAGPLDLVVNQKLRSFNISSFAPSVVLSLELNYFKVAKINEEDKITWKFSSSVRNVNLEHSLDGQHFTILKTFSISGEDAFLNKPSIGINYYRIAWYDNNGKFKFSNILSSENKKSYQISKCLLKPDGELSFLLGGIREENLSFKLLTIDGNVLSQTPARLYKPGLNQINFSKITTLNSVVVLAVFDDNKQKITMLVHLLN